MSRVFWLIEHISRGAFIDIIAHPKTNKATTLCRAESRRPAMIFATHRQASAMIEALADPQKMFSIQPINTE